MKKACFTGVVVVLFVAVIAIAMIGKLGIEHWLLGKTWVVLAAPVSLMPLFGAMAANRYEWPHRIAIGASADRHDESDMRRW